MLCSITGLNISERANRILQMYSFSGDLIPNKIAKPSNFTNEVHTSNRASQTKKNYD